VKAAPLLAAFLLGAALSASARTVTDMTGRRVTLPDHVSKVVCLSNNMMVYVYSLDWRKLAGWNFPPKAEARQFLDAGSLGRLSIGSMPGKSMNEETILALKPDLLLCSDEDALEDPDALQKRLRIPVVKVSVDLQKTAEVYELLGICLNEEARARELAAYARRILSETSRRAASVPASQRPRVYYAEGPEGLQTDASGNVHTQVLDFLKVDNVARVREAKVGAMAQVSFEQVLSWNPQVVLVGLGRSADTYGKILSDSRWRSLPAVRAGRVYQTPALPFNWFDRPPSPARLLGLQWLGHRLYPRQFPQGMAKATREFYRLFYRRNLSDAELRTILAHAGG